MKIWISLALALAGCSFALEPTKSDIAYGKHERHKLDIYLPGEESKALRPVAVIIHGGGWRIGDKASWGFVEPKTPYLLEKGFGVVSVNYRFSPEVVHPAHIEDVCAAIGWLAKNGKKHGLDSSKIYLAGHSAGAHLAAMAAVDHDRLEKAGVEPNWIKGAVLIDGAAYHVPNQIESSGAWANETFYLPAFTEDEEIQRDASPVLKVKTERDYAPILILACADRAPAVAQGKALEEVLKKAGGRAKLVAVPGKTHRTINRDLGKKGDPTTKAVEQFFEMKR